MDRSKEQTSGKLPDTQEGKFSGVLYRQRSEHQQKYNNENNDKLVMLIERIFPDATKRPLSICDLGCGHGMPTIDLLHKLKKSGILLKEMVGYDVSPSQVAEAIKLKDELLTQKDSLSFAQQDIQLLHDKNRFDVIFSWFTLHWMDDIQKACHSIWQALKPDGVIVYLSIIEKPTLFALREKLLKTLKWSVKFSDYTLKPFLRYNKSYEVDKQGYEDVFSKKFDMEPEYSSRCIGIRMFQTDREFINFLKSWMQELRVERNGKAILTEQEQDEYIVDLVNSIKSLKYNADADVNYLPDGRIEFHEHYVFYCWHKTYSHLFFTQSTTTDESAESPHSQLRLNV